MWQGKCLKNVIISLNVYMKRAIKIIFEGSYLSHHPEWQYSQAVQIYEQHLLVSHQRNWQSLLQIKAKTLPLSDCMNMYVGLAYFQLMTYFLVWNLYLGESFKQEMTAVL